MLHSCAVALAAFSGCSKPPPCSETTLTARTLPKLTAPLSQAHPFYVLGDWGTGTIEQRSVAEMLRADISSLEQLGAPRPLVLGAGDNVYPSGLTGGWDNLDENKELLHTTFGAMYDSMTFQGTPLEFQIVSGNHDHEGDILLQETLAEGMYDGRDASTAVWKFHPVDHTAVSDTNDKSEYEALGKQELGALLLPQAIETAGAPVLLIAVDSEILLRLYDDGETEAVQRHWDRLVTLVRGSDAPWKVIIAHHPLVSHGHHGRLLSPWTKFKRRFSGHSLRHVAHPAYQRYTEEMLRIIREHGVDLYLAGHEHELTVIDLGGALQIISGAAGEARETNSCSDTIRAIAEPGFFRLDFAPEQAAITMKWLEGGEHRTEHYVLHGN